MESSHSPGGCLYSQRRCLDQSTNHLPPLPSSPLCTDSQHFLAHSHGKCDIYERDHPSFGVACGRRLFDFLWKKLRVIWCVVPLKETVIAVGAVNQQPVWGYGMVEEAAGASLILANQDYAKTSEQLSALRTLCSTTDMKDAETDFWTKIWVFVWVG